MNLPYADSKAAFGVNPQDVRRNHNLVSSAVASRKLPLHQQTGVVTCGEFLGTGIDGIQGKVSATSKRIWRVRQAFDYLARRPRVSGDGVLIGHATYLFFFSRGLMCIMRHLYGFAARSGKGRTRLWESEARGAVWVRSRVFGTIRSSAILGDRSGVL